MSAALDCQTCGACCHGDEGWVHVDAADDARVDESPALAAHVVLTRHGGYVKRSLRMVKGACAALAATPSGVTCTIYDVRPSVCRELESGSDACHAARRARGLE
ncbi:MAG: YkgJ family cysteine cluster protein [Polyangiales bacterium]